MPRSSGHQIARMVRLLRTGYSANSRTATIVVRAADIPGQNKMDAYGDDPSILCVADDELRYIGEPVAIIVGPRQERHRTDVASANASSGVRIAYPPRIHLREILLRSGSRRNGRRYSGDPDAAFANAAHIVEGTCTTPDGRNTGTLNLTAPLADVRVRQNGDAYRRDAVALSRSVDRVRGAGRSEPRISSCVPGEVGVHLDGKAVVSVHDLSLRTRRSPR